MPLDQLHTFTPEQLDARRKYIGASEAYAIVNGAWTEVYEEKMGIKTIDLTDAFQVQLGLYTERFNLMWTLKYHPEYFDSEYYVEQANKIIAGDHKIETFIHPEIPYLGATPDAFGSYEDEPMCIDFKHTYAGTWGSTYQNQEQRVIDRYQWQMQQQMMCTETDRSLIVPIYGNSYGPPIILWADKKLQSIIIERSKKFWEHVELGVPPEDPDPVKAPTQNHDNMRVITEQELRTWNCAKEWNDLCCEFPRYHDADKKLKEIKSDFKALMPDDVKEIVAYGIKATRNRKGAVTIVREE